jgi:hypothetical protein
MKRIAVVLGIAVVSATLGVAGGRSLEASQAQQTNYLVIESFTLGADQAPAEAIERLSRWVRALRATGDHTDVRLFFHDWGPEAALYIVSETPDWNAVGNIFAEVLTVEPDLMNQPLGFAGHSDNILTEIPVP